MLLSAFWMRLTSAFDRLTFGADPPAEEEPPPLVPFGFEPTLMPYFANSTSGSKWLFGLRQLLQHSKCRCVPCWLPDLSMCPRSWPALTFWPTFTTGFMWL